MPPGTIARRSKAAVVEALTPFFGFCTTLGGENGDAADPVCKEASKHNLGEVMRAVEAATASGSLRATMPSGAVSGKSGSHTTGSGCLCVSMESSLPLTLSGERAAAQSEGPVLG